MCILWFLRAEQRITELKRRGVIDLARAEEPRKIIKLIKKGK